jgi:phenylalanyl-tRNA synthetase alpha chain
MSEADDLLAAARAEIGAAADDAAVARLKTKYLGREGLVRALFDKVKQRPAAERAAAGQDANRFKQEVERLLNERAASQARPAAPDLFDMTQPGTPVRLGGLHPIYQTWRDIEIVFEQMGFQVVRGPEIETRRNNFEALNIPLDHPAADAFDTFYITDELLLRSHTSPVQIRAMERMKPPLRIIVPGKVFRPDTADRSHLPVFHQVEGLMVGPDVTFAHLKTVLTLFARAMFGPQTRMRFRPSFFPFTEPSADVEMTCVVCAGRGDCPACSHGWMEILGSGMVHPNVFRAVGYDPAKVRGFAFGMGVERIAMIRYGITDIRLFLENRVAFLRRVGS